MYRGFFVLILKIIKKVAKIFGIVKNYSYLCIKLIDMMKITLNSIPIYMEKNEISTTYYLFEKSNEGNIINVNNNVPLGKQLDIVYQHLQEIVNKELKNINMFYSNPKFN